jgi:hypothetical protein
MQRGIGFNAMFAAFSDQSIDIHRKIARQKHYNVAISGSELRGSCELHGR